MAKQLWAEFEMILVELREGLDGLTNCLQAEREAIIDYNLQAITECHKEKSKVLEKINGLEKSRRDVMQRLCRALGCTWPANVDNLLNRLENVEQRERVALQLSCVKSLAQAANEFNESQRQYLAHSLANVQASLALLESLQGRGPYTASYNRQGVVTAGSPTTLGDIV